MKLIALAILPVLFSSAAYADQASLNAKLALFKKQSASMQALALDIENTALGCEDYKEEIEEKLVVKSKAARERLAGFTSRLMAIGKTRNRAEAEKILNEVGSELSKALAESDNEGTRTDLKFILECARPGNKNVGNKITNAVNALKALIKTLKAIGAELN